MEDLFFSYVVLFTSSLPHIGFFQSNDICNLGFWKPRPLSWFSLVWSQFHETSQFWPITSFESFDLSSRALRIKTSCKIEFLCTCKVVVLVIYTWVILCTHRNYWLLNVTMDDILLQCRRRYMQGQCFPMVFKSMPIMGFTRVYCI
jgi:hypothetical protein